MQGNSESKASSIKSIVQNIQHLLPEPLQHRIQDVQLTSAQQKKLKLLIKGLKNGKLKRDKLNLNGFPYSILCLEKDGAKRYSLIAAGKDLDAMLPLNRFRETCTSVKLKFHFPLKCNQVGGYELTGAARLLKIIAIKEPSLKPVADSAICFQVESNSESLNEGITENEITMLQAVLGEDCMGTACITKKKEQNVTCYYLDQPYYPGQDIGDQLRRRVIAHNFAYIILMLRCYLRELVFLHQHFKVVHGDVKPANVRFSFDPKQLCHLVDFGFSFFMKKPLDFYPGTPMFAAPEIIHKKKITQAVDYFAYGITLFLALGGERFEEEEGTYKLVNSDLYFCDKFPYLAKQDKTALIDLVADLTKTASDERINLAHAETRLAAITDKYLTEAMVRDQMLHAACVTHHEKRVQQLLTDYYDLAKIEEYLQGPAFLYAVTYLIRLDKENLVKVKQIDQSDADKNLHEAIMNNQPAQVALAILQGANKYIKFEEKSVIAHLDGMLFDDDPCESEESQEEDLAGSSQKLPHTQNLVY